jgi:hypothetical protein
MSRARLALTMMLALACASAAHAEPKERKVRYDYDAYKQSIRPLTRTFDAALGIRKLTGTMPEAFNVDENDQVRLPTTWWTPRVGFRPVTPEQMLAGPGSGTGPAPGAWTVVHAKSEGVSPGFQIKDAQGTRFAIKFDPPVQPELTTAADVITSCLLWAAGYNVPDNVIVTFRREDLHVKSGATYNDPIKGKRLITDEYLDGLLAKVARQPDGAYRGVASRFLSGKPLGEIDYEGRRKDDPEDLIPHPLRRELRGMWTVNAWLHNDDCSSRNSLDMWVTVNGRSFVPHYFLDFTQRHAWRRVGDQALVPQRPRVLDRLRRRDVVAGDTRPRAPAVGAGCRPGDPELRLLRLQYVRPR